MKTISQLGAIAFLAVGAVGIMGKAAADDLPFASKSLTVHFADLNLDKPPHAAKLLSRLKNAAREVCRPLDGGTLRQKHNFATCVDFALSNAVARVDRPVLTSAFVPADQNLPRTTTQVANQR